ncbi:hypothetical protein [Phenylobacterium sp. SCN 70-31]|uniref:DUF7673 family protein n=1 Tax=Phenylobacterium sp. SCN 70-31 TaxID=1660129 RepID=UPI000A7004D3|nr:hypothetical protein [Phenylobacterium sp. SCN 70-31]
MEDARRRDQDRAGAPRGARQRGHRRQPRGANFLLAWWNAAELGGFDPTEMWLLDDLAVRDLLLVASFIGRNNVYPDALIGREAVQDLIVRWHGRVVAD